VGFWDALTGRSRPKAANLDALFMVPTAAMALQSAADLHPTGVGSVCYRPAEGAAFSQTQADVVELLDNDAEGPNVERVEDRFGFTWLVVRRDAEDVSGLVTDLHAVNTTLEGQGFSSGLLCSLVAFTEGSDGVGRNVGLVYLYKQGTFYPFVPATGETRDNVLELQVRDLLAGELPVEPELNRWLAVWGAPGL
jgi:hypothetical protein